MIDVRIARMFSTLGAWLNLMLALLGDPFGMLFRRGPQALQSDVLCHDKPLLSDDEKSDIGSVLCKHEQGMMHGSFLKVQNLCPNHGFSAPQLRVSVHECLPVVVDFHDDSL